MDADTPGTIRLAGTLGAPEMASLTNYCRRLRLTGCSELSVNMDAVVDCHRAGFDGLRALADGRSGLAVSLYGAHWAQFMALLNTAPLSEIEGLRDHIRAFIDAAPAA